MNQFMLEYGFCMLLGIPGLFIVIMSYAAALAGRSGVPLFGGLLIAAGFLTSPCKWLALLGLIDYGCWYGLYAGIVYHIHSKRFEAMYAAQNFVREQDDTKRLRIRIPARNEEFLHPYVTNSLHELRMPKLLFSVCIDQAGNRFLLVDRWRRDGHIEMLPFDEDSIPLTELQYKGADMPVEIAVVRNPGPR